ncbi:MAG: hypothetical protein KA196_05195, partial [Arenimonas sp.]|nr:hypothetical protein [Arenimonas sp.]
MERRAKPKSAKNSSFSPSEKKRAANWPVFAVGCVPGGGKSRTPFGALAAPDCSARTPATQAPRPALT